MASTEGAGYWISNHRRREVWLPFITYPCHFQPIVSLSFTFSSSIWQSFFFIYKETLISSVKILNSSEYISYQLISLELVITMERDENVGRSTCNLDEVVDTYFLSWWKMYAFILSQTNLYCDLCFIIYVLDIVCFWQFFPVSDRFFFSLLEVRKAYISVLVFTFALLVVISLSYHTKSSYLSISIY